MLDRQQINCSANLCVEQQAILSKYSSNPWSFDEAKKFLDSA